MTRRRDKQDCTPACQGGHTLGPGCIGIFNQGATMNRNITEVEFQDVELDNQAQGGTSSKFYRTYAAQDEQGFWLAVFQWGRIGTTGQFKVQKLGAAATGLAGKRAAENVCNTQISTKRSKGYGNYRAGTFQVDSSKITADAHGAKVLDGVRHAAERTGQITFVTENRGIWEAHGPATDDDGDPVTTSTLAIFGERALKAITMAVTDPTKAVVEFATLQEEWREVEAEHERAASYLDTLSKLLAGA